MSYDMAAGTDVLPCDSVMCVCVCGGGGGGVWGGGRGEPPQQQLCE